jgi:hypothetical protein
LPGADKHGNPMFLDIRRWIPTGDIFDTNQSQGAIQVPAPLQFGGPLMLGAELALNKQAFTGKPIVNDKTDDIWDRAAKIADWAWKSWMPGVGDRQRVRHSVEPRPDNKKRFIPTDRSLYLVLHRRCRHGRPLGLAGEAEAKAPVQRRAR